MPTLKEYRVEANLSLSQLARRANIATATVSRAEDGLPVQELKAIAIARALSEVLGKKLTVHDIEDLKIYS